MFEETGDSFNAAMAGLKGQFVDQLQNRVEAISSAFEQLSPEHWQADSATELHRKIHSLSGAAGTFGLNQITETSRALENKLVRWLPPSKPPSPDEWSEAHHLLEQIMALSRKQTEPPPPDRHELPANCPAPSHTPLVFLFQPDTDLAQPLLDLVSTQGYRVRWINNDEDLYTLYSDLDELPAALLIDIDEAFDTERLTEWLQEMRRTQAFTCPVLMLSRQHDLQARLSAFRAGASRYLKKPVDPDLLIEALDVLTKRLPQAPYRVLMVDDDPLLLGAHAAILREAGMEVKALQDPLRVLEEMETFGPDVVLLDVYMPQAKGPEIAAVLRETDSQLPILFVSSETDGSRQLEALGHGGDDFIVKPVRADHLVARVSQKARRIRMLRTERSLLLSTLYERNREHVALDHHAIVSIADAQGRITYANEKFCQISGYTLDELIGQNHRILKSDKHSPDFYREMWHTLYQGQVWQGELCNRTKDGHFYWVEGTVTPFLDADGKPYQFIAIRTDITPIKENEFRLQKLHSMQQLVNEAASRLMNAAMDAMDSVITEVIQNTAETLGADRARLFLQQENDQTLFQVFAWQRGGNKPGGEIRRLAETDFGWWRQQMAQQGCIPGMGVSELPPSARQDLASIGEDDAKSICLIPFRQGGSLMGFMSFSTHQATCERSRHELDWLVLLADILGGAVIRQRATQAVMAIKERLRLGQIYANVGSWDWHIQTGVIFWSEGVAAMYGHADDDQEHTYDKFLQAVHPDDRQSVSDAIHACVTSDVPYDHRHRVVWPDGTVHWLHERGAVMRDPHGLPLEMFGIVHDVTEQVGAEQALVQARDDAQKANHSKSQFLSNMSHELRTPLNAIMGFGQLIEQDTALPETHQDNAREILKAGEHLLHLINDVLDLAKLEAGRITISVESFELDQLIHECVDLVQPLAQRRQIDLRLVGIGECYVRADRTRLKQVVLNLLSNAIKYNHEGGSVSLKVQPTDGARLRVWVRDTGPGIPAEKIKDLFQPFNRLGAENSKVEGTGIGLAITRRILQQMEGDIGVDSILGAGTAFWFELPQGQKPEEEPIPSPAETVTEEDAAHPSAYADRACLVLYIDDSPSNLRLVTRMLEPHARYRLVTADHPGHGLELALQHHPDLILLDLSMPEMDGFQVLQVLRSSRDLRHVPVIAVTANAMPHDIERGITAGFDGYLTKPVKIKDLLSAMDKVL